jgi:hypothetical protein
VSKLPPLEDIFTSPAPNLSNKVAKTGVMLFGFVATSSVNAEGDRLATNSHAGRALFDPVVTDISAYSTWALEEAVESLMIGQRTVIFAVVLGLKKSPLKNETAPAVAWHINPGQFFLSSVAKASD